MEFIKAHDLTPGKGITSDEDLVPQRAHVDDILGHAARQRGGGQAEQLAEDDVVALDQLAVLLE